MKPKMQKASKTQSELFIEKARELGADDSEGAGLDVMRRLAEQPKTERKPLKKQKAAK